MDTHAKRRAALAVSVVGLVLPIADAGGADSIAQRGEVAFVYAANVGQTNPLDLDGRFRVAAGHAYGVAEGHAYRVAEGHRLRVVELA